ATPTQGNATLGASAIPASGSGLQSGSGTVNVLVATAALPNAIPSGTPAASAASTALTNRSDCSASIPTGQTTAILAAPSPPRSGGGTGGGVYVVSAAAATAGMDPIVAVDALFASTDDLFGSIERF